MKRVNALVGVAFLVLMSGCAKQEAPAQAAVEPEDAAGSEAVAAPASTVAKPMAKDRAKAAADMIAFIDPSPQCQQYIDQLQALGQTQGSIDDLSGPYVQAYKAGCVIKKQQ